MDVPAKPRPLADSVYLAMRERILRGGGQLFRITTRDLAEETKLGDKLARQVLITLVGEGYLCGQATFSTVHLTREQFAEWSAIARSMTSIALSQISLRPGHAACEESLHLALAVGNVSGENRIRAFVSFVGSLFLADGNQRYLDVVSDIIPTAYFRIVCVFDTDDELVPAVLALRDQMAGGDHVGVLRANSSLWDAADRLIEKFFGSSFDDDLTERIKSCRERDVNLAGLVRQLSRSSLDRLFPPLVES